MTRFKVVLDACTAQQRDVISLHNWVKGTGSINQEEASFLNHDKDLMGVRTQSDETQSRFETAMVRAGVKYSRVLQKVKKLTFSVNGLDCSACTASVCKLTGLVLPSILSSTEQRPANPHP